MPDEPPAEVPTTPTLTTTPTARPRRAAAGGGPSVTVVVPTRNRPRLLAETLRSILAQECVTVEVVVVDDGHTPTAAEVVAATGDARVTAVHTGGGRRAGRARNVGLERARGPWVAFCDDDDVWSPYKLQAQLAAAERAGAAWACAGAVLVDERLRVVGHERLDPDDLRLLPWGNVIPGGGSNVVAATSAVRAAGGFDEFLAHAEDWDLWIRLAGIGPPAMVDRPLVGYRVWPGSKSADTSSMRRARRRILERQAQDPLPAEVAYGWDLYFLRKLTAAGQRARAAAWSARVSVVHRSPRHAVRAAALLVEPSLVERRDRRQRIARVPSEWRREAEEWLAELDGMSPTAGVVTSRERWACASRS